MLSLGTMVYLVARALPRVQDNEADQKQYGKIDALLAALPLERIDAFIYYSLEKTLRKIKVAVLKIDNLVTAYLGKIKPSKGIKKSVQSDLKVVKDITADAEVTDDKTKVHFS
jgi:hypothetical protein